MYLHYSTSFINLQGIFQTFGRMGCFYRKKAVPKGLRPYRSFITATISKTFTASYETEQAELELTLPVLSYK